MATAAAQPPVEPVDIHGDVIVPTETALDDSGECDGIDNDDFFPETVPLPTSLGDIPTSDITACDIYRDALAHPGHPEHWRSVTLAHMSRTITDAALVGMAMNTPHLRVLDLTYAESVTESGLIDFLGRVPELTELTLRRCSQSASDPAMARLALCCPHLVVLDVSFCPLVTDHGVGIVADRCPQLAELVLYGCNWVTDATAAKVSPPHHY